MSKDIPRPPRARLRKKPPVFWLNIQIEYINTYHSQSDLNFLHVYIIYFICRH